MKVKMNIPQSSVPHNEIDEVEKQLTVMLWMDINEVLCKFIHVHPSYMYIHVF